MSARRAPSSTSNPTAGPRRNGRRNGQGPALLVLLALLGLLPSCSKALMDPDKPRSQFDRFDAIREQRSPSTVDDEFGMRRINVRGRLLPKD